MSASREDYRELWSEAVTALRAAEAERDAALQTSLVWKREADKYKNRAEVAERGHKAALAREGDLDTLRKLGRVEDERTCTCTRDGEGFTEMRGCPEHGESAFSQSRYVEELTKADARTHKAEAERDRLRGDVAVLMAGSWEAYEATGADTDGDDQWHCDPVMAVTSLMHAVQELRNEYDEALTDVPAGDEQ